MSANDHIPEDEQCDDCHGQMEKRGAHYGQMWDDSSILCEDCFNKRVQAEDQEADAPPYREEIEG